MIEWLVDNVSVSAVGTPDRAERTILGVILAGRFFPNSSHICGRGAPLWCRVALFSPTNFTYGYLMIMEWLVTNVRTVGSSDRADPTIFWGDFGCFFYQFRPYLWSGSLFVCDAGTPSWALVNFIQGHLMKIGWLVTNVTPVRYPDREEHAILGVILAYIALFPPIHAVFVVPLKP